MAFGREDVVVRFGGDTSGLNRSLGQIDAGVSRLRGAFAGLAGAFTVGAFANFAKQTLSWADALANTSQRIGVSTERIQTLRNEAEKLGLSFQQVDDGLTRFSVELGKARNGTGELGKSLQAYGIALRTADGQWRNASDILQDYTELMRGMGDETEKNRLSNVAFGRGNIELGQTLASLQGTLDEVTQQHRELARVLDDESVQALANLETRYTETMQTLATITKSTLVYAMDELSQFWNGLKTIGGKVLFGFDWQPGQGGPAPQTGTPAAPRVPVAVPSGAGGVGGSKAGGLNPEFNANLQALIAEGARQGFDLGISSGFRTAAKQAELYAAALRKYGSAALARQNVAPPGSSLHEKGLAADLTGSAAAQRWVAENAARFGLGTYTGPGYGGSHIHVQMIDQAKAAAAAQAELAAKTKAAADARAEYDRVMQEGLAVQESVRTAAEQHAVTVERLVYLYQQGALGAVGSAGALETYRRAVEASAESLKKLKTKTEKTKEVADELGFTFSSAFEQAVVEGQKLRDILKGIAQDVLRIFVRETVTKPVGTFLSTIFSGLLGGGVKSEHGNVMTASGPMALRRYAAGGIATSPQLAIFGEGSGAEAYVPLPDGRRIPVAMQSPGVEITINNGASVDGWQPRVSNNGRGQLTIDMVRAALADDARRGGMGWTRGLEAAYGLGRAR